MRKNMQVYCIDNVEEYRDGSASYILHIVRTLKFINIYIFLWVRSHKENKEK